MRQFPRWREFKRNADKDTLSVSQVSDILEAAAEFIAVLESNEAEEFIDPSVPETLEELGEPVLEAKGALSTAAIDAGAELLAEDLLESIDNTLKALAEAALNALSPFGRGVREYARGLGRGFEVEATVQATKDGQRLFRWVHRFLVAGMCTAGAWMAGLLSAFPDKLGWLTAVLQFLSKFAG
jgi:hypothetical protein